jgi:hypothetical protein
MRLSELLASSVVDRQGRSIGRVRDVRLVEDGPLVDGVQAAFRVDAVLVGGGKTGTRIGYERGEVRGPLLVRWVFRRAERRAQTIPMTDLEWDVEQRLLRPRETT